MKEENIIIKAIINFLKRIGIVKEVEIDKREMCKLAWNTCNKKCYMCAWNYDGDYKVDKYYSL